METESFVIKSDISSNEIKLRFMAKVLEQDLEVALTFTKNEFENFIDMLTYCAKQKAGVSVTRDLSKYVKV